MADGASEVVRGYERVRYDQTLWTCSSCGGVLEPLGDSEKDSERNSVDWWGDVEKWADVPAVECLDCGQRYQIEFVPLDDPNG
jgi:hypothetical protein